MRVDLIKIGNSKGVRLPKPLLEACGFVDSVELEVRGQQLILSPSSSPRAGWAEACRWNLLVSRVNLRPSKCEALIARVLFANWAILMMRPRAVSARILSTCSGGRARPHIPAHQRLDMRGHRQGQSLKVIATLQNRYDPCVRVDICKSH